MLAASGIVLAQEYPTRVIRIIVAQAPSSGPDITARAIGQKLTESWGQQVIIENRAGANGIIGGDMVAKAKPDGYTLLLGVNSAMVMNPFVYKNLPYDPLRDLAPVTQIVTNTFGLVVTPTLPAASVKALVALAKARPGELTFGSAGIGNMTHLSAELFARVAGVKLLHVPYKGTTPAQIDLMSGHISLMFVTTRGGGAAHCERQSADVGNLWIEAHGGVSGRTDAGGVGLSRPCLQRVEWFACARWHAAGHHQQTLEGDCQPSRRSGISGAHVQPRGGAHSKHAGGICRVHQGGCADVVEADTRYRIGAQPVAGFRRGAGSGNAIM